MEIDFQKCKFFPHAVVYTNDNPKEYSLIRSACGPNYDYFSRQNVVMCPNVGFIIQCNLGHKMTYQTSELMRFAQKASVKCRLCGAITFVRDAELICLSNVEKCDKQL